jgi:hypothetical protein
LMNGSSFTPGRVMNWALFEAPRFGANQHVSMRTIARDVGMSVFQLNGVDRPPTAVNVAIFPPIKIEV